VETNDFLVSVPAESSADNDKQNKQDNDQCKAITMPSAHPAHLLGKSITWYAIYCMNAWENCRKMQNNKNALLGKQRRFCCWMGLLFIPKYKAFPDRRNS
jgi:hypothetical protein